MLRPTEVVGRAVRVQRKGSFPDSQRPEAFSVAWLEPEARPQVAVPWLLFWLPRWVGTLPGA